MDTRIMLGKEKEKLSHREEKEKDKNLPNMEHFYRRAWAEKQGDEIVSAK